MISRLKIIVIIEFLFLFSACQKIIEIDLPKHEIKPVVNCLFSPGRPFKVHVSLSSVPTDTATYLIEDARVVIVEKGGLATQLKSVGKGYYFKKIVSPQKRNRIYFKGKSTRF